MRFQCLFLFLLVSVGAQAQLNFPGAYSGSWKGNLHIANPAGASQDVAISLRIDSLKVRASRGTRYGWVIHYQGQEPRKYELVVVDAKAGRYQIDEKDGIVLDAVLIENRLVSQFEVEGSLLTSIYTFLPGKILFELFFSSMKTTKTGPRSGPPVTLYPVGGYHRAELTH
jgi:hypothetical protein